MKIKHASFTFLFYLFINTLAAQETEKVENKSSDDFKGFISISIGPSVPLGEYANKDINNLSAGLAKSGLNYQANFNYLIGSGIGVGLKGYYFYNPQDAKTWLNAFLDSANINQHFKVKTKSWEYTGAAFGLFSTFKLEESYADLKVLFGVARVKFPAVFVELNEGNSTFSDSFKAENQIVPFFEIDFSLRIPVAAKIDAIANFDYMTSNAKFNVINKNNNLLYTQNNQISVINISFGAALKF